jgi:glutathione S-transferase
MLLYLSIGPNPRVVRMALVEKGLQLDTQIVDIMRGENRRAPYSTLNPAGQTPALELDDGRILGESVAIVEYLEEVHPEPTLMGDTAEARAMTRMWVRRIDFAIVQPLTMGFRAAEGLPLFKDRMRCFPEAAEGLKAAAQDGLAWLEPVLADQAYLTGDRVLLPDLLLYSFLDFGAQVGQPLQPAHRHLTEWFSRMAERPSALETAGPPR